MELRKILLFKELDEKSLKKIEQFSTIHHLKKGDIVFYEGDKSTNLHIIVKGVVSVYKTNLKGDEILIHKFYPTSLIAERANLANMNFPATCKMDEDGVILKIDFLKFKQILTEPDICFKIMQSLLNKMNSLDDVIINMMLDTETKVAKFIYENTETFENLKQHLIADLLNIKPETLSRKLKKFKEKGIIENNHSKIKVINKEKIKELYPSLFME